MIFYDAHDIEKAPWPDTDEGRKARGFLVPLFEQGARAFFGDRTTLRLLAFEGSLIPLSINEAEYDNSFFFSLFARYVTSLRANLKAGKGSNPRAAFAQRAALGGLGALLKAASVDKIVQIDNWPTLRNMGA